MELSELGKYPQKAIESFVWSRYIDRPTLAEKMSSGAGDGDPFKAIEPIVGDLEAFSVEAREKTPDLGKAELLAAFWEAVI
jgi:hypothetical protein